MNKLDFIINRHARVEIPPKPIKEEYVCIRYDESNFKTHLLCKKIDGELYSWNGSRLKYEVDAEFQIDLVNPKQVYYDEYHRPIRNAIGWINLGEHDYLITDNSLFYRNPQLSVPNNLYVRFFVTKDNHIRVDVTNIDVSMWGIDSPFLEDKQITKFIEDFPGKVEWND